MRAFIAIDIPEHCRGILAEIGNDLEKLGARAVKEEQLHITLFFFAEIGEEKVNRLFGLLGSLDRRKFTIDMSGLGVFDKKRPNVIFANIKDSAELSEIFEYLKTKILGFGVETDNRGFVPHLTIARTRNLNEQRLDLINDFVERKKESICSFECDGISLIESVLTSAGPVHKRLYTKRFE